MLNKIFPKFDLQQILFKVTMIILFIFLPSTNHTHYVLSLH